MRVSRILVCVLALFFSNSALSETQRLLSGEVRASADQAAMVFSLSGESQQEVVGGEIQLGSRVYVIQKVSMHSLIGAQRATEMGREFAVFSSSYSDQTATGAPWVKAQSKYGCELPYNSFIVLYTIESEAKLAGVAELPYADLIDSLKYSDQSVLYCFIAKPAS